MEKYKFFIKNVYIKIKESLVKEIPNKNNKFSILNDIYNYLFSNNKKYSEKIDLHKIIQGNNEEFEMVNKITKYLTELFFNLDYVMKMIKLVRIIMLTILMITIIKIILIKIFCQNMKKRQIKLVI